MPKLKYFDDYCLFGNNRIPIDEFTAVLEKVTLPHVAEHFGISLYITKSIMSRYNLENKRHYETGLPTVFFDDDSVIYDGNKVSKTELMEYYIDTNHSKEETMQHFKLSGAAIDKAFKNFSIRKSSELCHERVKMTSLERYGDENYNNTEKNKQTVLERYGVSNVFQAQFVKDKTVQTNLQKYGYNHPMKCPDIKHKLRETMINHYGVVFQRTPEFKEKCQATSLLRYGATHHMKTAAGKAKFNFSDIGQKVFETKKRNGTTNTSKPENSFNEFLLEHFRTEDIVREYKSQRYPFHCDFYIKSLDMFIELNLFFTHGAEPFDESNADHQKLLSYMRDKAQTSDFYKNAIYIWTKLDPLKLSYMKKNNLNYRVCYNDYDINELKKELVH